MERTINAAEKVEARDAETVLTDENATVDELVEVTSGRSIGETVETTKTGPSFEEVFGASTETVAIGIGVAGLVSLVIAVVLFFTVVMKKKSPKGKFSKYLREFLNFRKVWIASILKFVYVFMALFLTLGCIVMMFFGGDHAVQMILICLFTMVFGNIFLRVMFEMMMITIGLWENTRDLRGVLVKSEEAPEEEEKIDIEVEGEEDKVEE